MLADETRMLPFGTDFFWHNRGDRFLPMRFNSERSHLVSTCAESACVIAWSPEEIVSALQRKLIVPNVYLMMMTLSILPSVRVNGGRGRSYTCLLSIE
ncbi:hypothetical protein BTE77_35280 [Ensifer adhaerens]|nr:hypothetical protein BTE77_35280 [Ensifer adhaerens]